MKDPVYLLRGDPFLADEALDKIRTEAGLDPLAEVSFGPDAPPGELADALGTPSLLGGRRLVIVRDAQDLKKDQVQTIESYLASPSPDTTLVLIASGTTKLAATVKERGNVIALEAPRGKKLVMWLRERARIHGIGIDDRAAWALVDAVGTGLRELGAALEQLATGAGPKAQLGPGDVRRAFPRLADERIYVLTDAVGERKLPAAMGTLRRLLDQGEEPLVLFGAISAHVRRLVVGRDHAERGPRALADALGMPEWRARKLHAQIKAFREDELVDAMGVLARTDVEMKGGDLPPELALERAVIEIVTGAVRS